MYNRALNNKSLCQEVNVYFTPTMEHLLKRYRRLLLTFEVNFDLPIV